MVNTSIKYNGVWGMRMDNTKSNRDQEDLVCLVGLHYRANSPPDLPSHIIFAGFRRSRHQTVVTGTL
jgi:hypothetical protein